MTTIQPSCGDAADTSTATLDDANCIVLRLDGKGRVTSLNPFGLAFFGYEFTEIVGRHVVGTIVPEKDRTGSDLGAMIDDLLLRPAEYTHQINENRRKNGDRVWVVWSNRAFFDAEGKVTRILCVGNDITDRKAFESVLEASRLRLTETIRRKNRRLQEANARLKVEVEARRKAQQDLEESRDRYRLLSRVQTEGVVFHEEGIAIEANDAFVDLTGCPRERLIGKDVVPLFTAPQDVDRVRRVILASDVHGYEITGCNAGGHAFPAELRTRSGELGGRP
ncbi:MAG TPA: PAS domain S-box protein, partial [Desulfosarcina sp.]|nr:PAS domain S-box protein [Desulfosarcina sp.]